MNFLCYDAKHINTLVPWQGHPGSWAGFSNRASAFNQRELRLPFFVASIGQLIPRLRRRASRTIIGSGRLMPSLTWPASAPYRYNTNRGSDGRASSQHRKSCATVSRLLNSGSSKHLLCCLRRQRAPLHRPLDDASAHGQGTCCLDDKLR